jgi:septal ring factor EnvC (AmiA/AmiB activator)
MDRKRQFDPSFTPARSALAYCCARICPRGRSRPAKSIQADIAAKQRAISQQQQQRASLLAQLKAQEEAISAAARKLRETQDSLNQLNKQIDEMNASIAKLERQRASQERNLAAQLDAAFRQGRIPASR